MRLLCGEVDLEAVVDRLRGVRYMSTMAIEQLILISKRSSA